MVWKVSDEVEGFKKVLEGLELDWKGSGRFWKVWGWTLKVQEGSGRFGVGLEGFWKVLG